MISNSKRPIGIFDSGLGGLTTVKCVRRLLPYEDIVYFGDTARVPYGNKSKATVIRFAREIMAFLLDKKVKMAVVACNTASSLSLSLLKESYRIPVIGVIEPGVKEALKYTKNGRIGVIGTSSTIASGAYDKTLARLDKSARIFSASCPLFVPLVENRHTSGSIVGDIAKMYLTPLKKKNIDTLVLGCTHYPILKSAIGKVMGKTKLIDSSLAVAKETKKVLSDNQLESPRRKGSIQCFVSDDVKGFTKSAGIFLKEKISVKKAAM